MAQHPTEETMNITRKFLGGEVPGRAPGEGKGVLPQAGRQLPAQASPVAQDRAFGQKPDEGIGGLLRAFLGRAPATSRARKPSFPDQGWGSRPRQKPFERAGLPMRFPDVTGPPTGQLQSPDVAGFAATPQGQAVLSTLLTRMKGRTPSG